jgi:glycosyltransferase involved in cell wall biosynthesis
VTPQISIIIPTKHEGQYIETTLKQFLPIKQQLGIEVIVSDGGSSDNTLEIARKYADRVLVPKKGEKQNIAIGRNAGAKVAKADILFHTDADVIIPNKPDFFAKLFAVFEDENIVAATFRLRVYPDEESLTARIVHNVFFNGLVRLANHFGSIAAKGECQVVRASTFHKINGYDENIAFGEDAHLFSRLSKLGRIVYLNDLVVYHSPRRFHKQGYFKVLALGVREAVCLYILRRPYLKEWAPVR